MFYKIKEKTTNAQKINEIWTCYNDLKAAQHQVKDMFLQIKNVSVLWKFALISLNNAKKLKTAKNVL